MRGYLILLLVALACRSMFALDLELTKIKDEWKSYNRLIKGEVRRLEVLKAEEEKRTSKRDELAREIAKIENDLLSKKLDLAKAKIMLDREELLQVHCPISEKNREYIQSKAEERVKEQTADLDTNGLKDMRAKFSRLLPYDLYPVDNLHPSPL